MKLLFLLIVVGVGSQLAASAQGTVTFVYDQQSATESSSGGSATTIQTHQPIGQSFTPTLSSVGFVRLFTGDRTNNNGIGATLSVNLMSGSITGPVLGSTAAVGLQDSFVGYTDFVFATPVDVTPGTLYFFQPIVQSGDTWAIINYNYSYPNGTAFANGVASPGFDMWFREGIIIPEPSSAWLALAGAGVFALFFRRGCARKCARG